MNPITLAFRAGRSFRRHPSLSAAIVAVLGLGMGATVALFSIVNGLVIRPLPYPESEQLVQVWSQLKASGLAGAFVSYPRYEAYTSQSTAFAEFGAFWKQDFSISTQGDSVRLTGARISASLFHTLEIAPVHGRLFTSDEDRPGGAAVALISAGLWRSRFGSSPDTVGSNVTIDGKPFTIVGIIPGPFVFARDCCDVFVPRVFEPDTLSRRAIERGAGYLTVIGRLRPGIAVDAAIADLRAISRRYTAEHRDNTDGSFEPQVVPLAAQVLGDAEDTLALLLIAGALVFVTAAANVGGLFLIRHMSRGEELALQRALGAERRHLIVPLLAESLTLALAAVVVAFVAVASTLSIIRGEYTSVLPHWNIRLLDVNVVLFALALVCITCVLAGLIPALSVTSRSAGRDGVAPQSRGATRRPREARWLTIFAVTQLALSFTLLSTAIDVGRSMWRLQRVDVGYSPRALLTAQIAPSTEKYADIDAQSRFYKRLRERLLQLPEVADAGTSLALPVIGDQRIPYRIDGRPAPRAEEHPIAQFRFVDAGYFAAMAIPLRRGRTFSDADTRESAPVAVISESLSRREFGERDPIGEQIVLATTPARRIVGVVGDVRELGAAFDPEAGVYIPLQQMFIPRLPPMYIAVRARTPDAELTESVRRAALSVDPDQPLARVRLMRDIVNEGLAVPRLRALLASVFAGIGMLLAALGVYSAISHAAVRRVTEFGVRLALGASHASVAAMMLRTTAALTAASIAGGIVATGAFNRVLGRFLGDVIVTNSSTLVFTAAILAASAGLATLVPALRILRIDPAQALRADYR